MLKQIKFIILTNKPQFIAVYDKSFAPAFPKAGQGLR